MATQTNNNCNCGSNAHPECCCGHRIAVDPCLPVQNVKCKVVRQDGTGGNSLQAGYGVEIDNGTISVQKRDLLFDQADAVTGNNVSFYDLSADEDGNALTLLQLAENMPQEATVNFMDSLFVDCHGMYKQHTGTFTTLHEGTVFYGSKMSSNGGTWSIDIDMSAYVHTRLAKYIDRLIIAASPIWLNSADAYAPDYSSDTRSSASHVNMDFRSRKAFDLPEENALMIYADHEDCVRLNDRLHLQYALFSHHYYFQNERFPYVMHFDQSKTYLMGRSYSELKSNGFEGISGYFTADTTTGPVYPYYFDAFFGAFPYSRLTGASYHYGVHSYVITLYFHPAVKQSDSEGYRDMDMFPPRMRVFFPKNEVIRKIKRLIAEGAIDEYGNETTT